jgi:hypothetical protein
MTAPNLSGRVWNVVHADVVTESLRLTTRCRLPAEPKPDGSAAIGALAADCSTADCCGVGGAVGAAVSAGGCFQVRCILTFSAFTMSRAMQATEMRAPHTRASCMYTSYAGRGIQHLVSLAPRSRTTLTAARRGDSRERQLHVQLPQQSRAQLGHRRHRVRRQQAARPQHRRRKDTQRILAPADCQRGGDSCASRGSGWLYAVDL